MATNRIFVELEALLDTRFSLFKSLDPLAAEVWLAESYRMRYSDEFWKISQILTKEQVEEAWAKRDMRILRGSMRTLVPDLLRAIIASIDWGYEAGDPSNKVVLTVNTAPYNMPAPEQEKLVQVLECLFPMVAEIRLVNVPLWALQPRQLGEDFELAVFYNFMEWFRTYVDRMDEFQMGNIHVIAPKIFAKLPEPGSKEWKGLQEGDMFNFLQGRFWGRAQLVFESIDQFSVIGA